MTVSAVLPYLQYPQYDTAMSTLTDNDLQAVADARQLADAPYPDDTAETAQELRRAKILLAYLAGIIEQAQA
jgi:hypothetical protein